MSDQPFSDLYDDLAQARKRFLDEIAPLRPDLFRYALGLSGSPWDAEDLVQEALTRAFANLGKFERVRNLRAYVFRITTNAWLDVQRRKRPSELEEEIQVSQLASATLCTRSPGFLRARSAALPSRSR